MARHAPEPEELDPPGNLDDGKGTNGGVRTLNLVRGYALLVIGLGLIVWSFIGETKPGALTLGGALVGFNPLFRATIGNGHGH